MSDKKEPPEKIIIEKVFRTVGKKEAKKIEAGKKKAKSLWFGLGMFGMIGWSIAIPMLIGVVIGVWLDERFPGRFSWTLTLLFIGTILGCWNAWRWVQKEIGND
ncbi:MAG: AtpZ/AtpI family protein [Vulcanimicrobiota bacterium]